MLDWNFDGKIDSQDLFLQTMAFEELHKDERSKPSSSKPKYESKPAGQIDGFTIFIGFMIFLWILKAIVS